MYSYNNTYRYVLLIIFIVLIVCLSVMYYVYDFYNK